MIFMGHPLLDVERVEQAPDTCLNAMGSVFAVFGGGTQDSGNVSYGVQIGRERYFVKTAGLADDPKPLLSHSERVSQLRNAARLRRSCSHRALPRLHRVIESASGPMLVYQWVDGEPIKGPFSESEGSPSRRSCASWTLCTGYMAGWQSQGGSRSTSTMAP